MITNPGKEATGKESKEAGAAEKNPNAPPVISLPKGGGAIRGIGEKFAANPVTGTGSMTVPIATSPGRSGFGPQLSLSYDSGAGNGPFGFGWSLSLPAITRKTDKGLPQYQDAEESDVFILSGAEDLVPVLKENLPGQWSSEVVPSRTVDNKTYSIRRYRPRIEGLFARIERWTNQADATDTFWRSISKDNVTTWYGRTANSRIASADLIFSWLICESYDDKGNVIAYEYKEENSNNIDRSQAHERNRTADTRKVNRYLKHIRYGNHDPYFPKLLPDQPWPTLPGDDQWFFEVVFDYDEGRFKEQPTDPDGRIFAQVQIDSPAGSQWPVRQDPFSSYRAGFEVRTYRLCRRVLMFHHFPGEAEVGADCLVRSTDFTYSDEANPTDVRNPIYSFLLLVTQNGYKRQGGVYLKKSLPPVEFEYTEPIVQEEIHEVDPESLENLPVGPDGRSYQWTDLHGEGIPGILTEQGSGWFYKRNLSPINEKRDNGTAQVAAKFAPIEQVAVRPNLALAGGAQFMDLAGDGQPDLVALDGPMPGLYEHDDEEGWQPFRPFTSRLNRDSRDPNLKFIDLDGDGHADVLITEDDTFVWHSSLAEEGFSPARRVAKVLDEEKGPRIVFADGTQSIYLADLSGDGLTDIVRIRNGEVCYWPNLGYGRFGAKVTMDNAPRFDHPDQFDQKRIRLADIDGSGTTDIIYLHRDGVRLYFNQSGNSWSQPNTLKVFPRVDDLVSIVPIDLLGNGTACLVWSSPLPGDARRPMRYVNLIGNDKPHLLVKTKNNLGAETRVQYAPSTKFYLQDKYDGKPWITRLPFPVHVVERVETYDHISRNRFVTCYAYHHGYFDGEEREFRGFGMVEQWDTEQFAALVDGNFPADNIVAESHVPPVHTKTWFHTGVYDEVEEVCQHFATEYYGAPEKSAANYDAAFDSFFQTLLPDTVVPRGLTLEEEREACRALKGSMLRQEVYADDADHPGATPAQIQRAHTPYTVTEQNFTIRPVQPRGGNRHTVFFIHAREAINYHYERNPADPRIQHALTLEVDDFGNVLKQTAIGYGRRQRDTSLSTEEDRDKQALIHITYTENVVTNAIDDRIRNPDGSIKYPDDYRTPLPAESRTYELRKPRQEKSAIGSTRLYRFDDVDKYTTQVADGNHDVLYEDIVFFRAQQAAAAVGAESDRYFRRLIEHVRTLYRPDDCGTAQNDPLALLQARRLEKLALPGESYKLAFTPGLLAQVFQRPRSGQTPEALLPQAARASVLGGTAGDQGGYIDLDGDGSWWVPLGRSYYHSSAVAAADERSEARLHFFLPRRYRDPFVHDAFVDFDANDLLMTETRDALGNRVKAETNDYRVLQPRLVSDPNGNQTEVAFDTLGMVVGTAVMGKPTDNPRQGDRLDTSFLSDAMQSRIDAFIERPREASTDPNESIASQAAHDLLANATTRIVYDLERFKRLGEPPFAATIARETHVSDLPTGERSKLQISFSYSDGFGREIQKKIQAEPGPLVESGPKVSPRWVGSGWTIFNNKGKPVRQYEPFFSMRQRPDGTLFSDHRFEFGVMVGVSPVLFYDPAERVVATLHPNHTWEKVVFDPWQQTTFDVNDTVLNADGSTDPAQDADAGSYFLRLAAAEYSPTWYEQRIALAANDAERIAADKAAVHRQTPTVAHLDALGRSFLTVAHNRFERNGAIVEEKYPTRVELDIEGNQRAVRDAVKKGFNALGNEIVDELGRVVMRYVYDMLGNRIHQLSMEAGARWMLNDVAGKPIRAWDSRGFTRRMTYDELRRPTGMFVVENGAERLAEKTVYGEGQGTANNHRTRVFQVFDGAGRVASDVYDFKGNLLRSTRDLLPHPYYKNAVDWNLNPAPNDGSYSSSTAYGALNRPTAITAPDSSVYCPAYNEANLLDKADVNLRGERDGAGQAKWTPFLTNIDYNAKGQRTLIRYQNGAETTYRYDEQTFRLVNLKTTRPSGSNGLASRIFAHPATVQDLRYTYDPAGNITRIEDAALATRIHAGQTVEPVCRYTYDAIYRLIEATGREHIDQSAFQFAPPNCNYRDYPFVGPAAANDPQAVRNYTERYEYDPVGNFERMRHIRANGGWTRGYAYGETSLIEDGAGLTPRKTSNRLSRTTLHPDGASPVPESYNHDAHGNMTAMPHLPLMKWDFEDQLSATSKQATSHCTPETTFYAYDAAGQRVRKVTERQNGTRKDERIYLGGFEIYREYDGPGTTVTLERETLHVMDDKQRIALVETKTIENSNRITKPESLQRYQFGNHLGSACLELDGEAQIISYEEYAPYGSTTYQAVRSQTETVKRYRYTGMERDEENGFSFHQQRYLVPWLGRWCSCDPIGLGDGLNLYAYCHCNPESFSDRSGTGSDVVINKKAGDAVRKANADALRADAKARGLDRKIVEEKNLRDAVTGKTTKVGPEGPDVEKPRRGQGIRTRRQLDIAILDPKSKTAVALEIGTTPEALEQRKKGVQLGKDDAAIHLQKAAVPAPEKELYRFVGTAKTGPLPPADPSGKVPPIATDVSPELVEVRPVADSRVPVGAANSEAKAIAAAEAGAENKLMKAGEEVVVDAEKSASKLGKLGKGKGLVLGVVLAGGIYFKTGDAYAAGQVLNPVSNLTDVATGEDVNGSYVLAAGKDIVGMSPLGLVSGALQVGMAGGFEWLGEKAKAGLAATSELLGISQVEREWSAELTRMYSP